MTADPRPTPIVSGIVRSRAICLPSITPRFGFQHGSRHRDAQQASQDTADPLAAERI
jgi:hypothetical protein